MTAALVSCQGERCRLRRKSCWIVSERVPPTRLLGGRLNTVGSASVRYAVLSLTVTGSVAGSKADMRKPAGEVGETSSPLIRRPYQAAALCIVLCRQASIISSRTAFPARRASSKVS